MQTNVIRRPQKPAFLLASELRAAQYARAQHSQDCPQWDYVETNCEACDRHDAAVRELRRRLGEARAWEGSR